MTIKHLVLGGGGAGGFAVYGALKYLAKNNYWNVKDIVSIYATSVGSIIAIYITLKYDWDTLDDYLIKRPWDKIINIKPTDILNLWSEKGIFNENIIKSMLKPLLEAKELSENITLKDLYEYTSVDLHIYTTNINELFPIKIDISYKTHPNLEVYKAVAMSSAIPLVFSPICDNSNCYIDGGLLNNFPLDDCINYNSDTNEILAFKISSKEKIHVINENSGIHNYFYNLLNGMRRLISTENQQTKICNMIDCKLEDNTVGEWKDALIDSKIRQHTIELGENYGKKFLSQLKNSDNIIESEPSQCIQK